MLGFKMLARIIKAVANRVPDQSGLVRPICCLLILWAGIDSQAFQLSQSGFLLLGCNSPLSCPQGSDNDEMLIVVSDSKVYGRKEPNSLTRDFPGTTVSDLSICRHSFLVDSLADATCEPDHRNGFGAPLLC